MKYFIIILFLTISTSYARSILYNISSDNDYSYKNRDIKVLLKAPLYSAIVPGSGQYFVHNNKLKGMIMFSLDIVALIAYDYYNKQADVYKEKYQDYGDLKWDFAHWCSNYYNWNDSDNEFFQIFSNNETENYPEISEDSHHFNFWYNNDGVTTFLSTSSDNFQELYDSEGFSSFENIDYFIENNDFILEKDHHFYENIVKYNHFFSGWEDSDSSIYIITTSNGYKTAFSPNKLTYRNYYDKSVESYQFRDLFLNIIFINHFFSVLDALVVSKLSNNNLSLSFDYNSKINFYEANLSIKLK